MEKIIEFDLLCVWVTFIDELASLGEQTISMVSTIVQENPALRTFKILRMSADGLSYRDVNCRKTQANIPNLKGAAKVMKAFLMYKDRDFDLQRELPPNEQALTQDLALNTLFEAMALGDNFLFEVARKAVLSSLNDPDSILYRQNILKDCLKNSSIVMDIYNVAIESIENKKKHWWGLSSRYPSSILYGSVEALKMFVGQLKKLRNIADENADKFDSEGFARFFAMLRRELSNEYFARIEDHLRELKFRKGVLISAELGKGNKAANFVLHKHRDKKQSWVRANLWAKDAGLLLSSSSSR